MKKSLFMAFCIIVMAVGCKKDDPQNLLENTEYVVVKVNDTATQEPLLPILFKDSVPTDGIILYLGEENRGYIVRNSDYAGYEFSWKYQRTSIQFNFDIFSTDTGQVLSTLEGFNASDFASNRDFGLRIGRNEGVELTNNFAKFELVKR